TAAAQPVRAARRHAADDGLLDAVAKRPGRIAATFVKRAASGMRQSPPAIELHPSENRSSLGVPDRPGKSRHDALRHSAADIQARISVATWPATSVNRKSRPA